MMRPDFKAIPVRRYCPGSSPDKDSDYVVPGPFSPSVFRAVTFVRFGSPEWRSGLSPFLRTLPPPGFELGLCHPGIFYPSGNTLFGL